MKIKIKTRSKVRVKIRTIPSLTTTEWKEKLDNLFMKKDNNSYIDQVYAETFDSLPVGIGHNRLYYKLAYFFFKRSIPPESWATKSNMVKRRYTKAQNLMMKLQV